tara:strand:+ start:830 stop:1219 length:390 start_codon:yes stop_codon:yes gene_type:complete
LPIVKRWSDFDLDFTAHPNTGELSMKRDENAIVRSVQYLLLTDHYERPFHPEIGSNLRKQLFEPMTYATVLRIRDAIIECLNNFEPRVQLTNVEVNPDYDRNSYDVSLRYYILNEEVERQTRFLLERTR